MRVSAFKNKKNKNKKYKNKRKINYRCGSWKSKKKNRVYFSMEPVLGGTLSERLKDNGRFEEETAKFYAANVIEGLKYIHSKGIIYRDLKPENLMIHSNGYLKFVDFKFAKIIGDKKCDDKKYTELHGIADFMAPYVNLKFFI